MVRIKTLLDLLGSSIALLCLAPVAPFLDRPLLLLAFAAVGLGLWCDRRERFPLTTWPATLLGLAGIGFYALRITRADVATPVVHALVVLLVIRLLTPKQGRDYLQIFVLALFILAGSSLLSLEVGFLGYLVLLVFGVTIGLVLLTVYVTEQRLALPRRDLLKLLRVSLILPVVSLLLMVVFFFALPRTRHPLWNFLNPKAQAVVGLSETVQPGSFARISSIQNLAFRVEAPELAPEDLYWRALVLNRPDGAHWVRTTPPPHGAARLVGPRPVRLVFYPEPRSDRYLITLDRPSMLTGIRHTTAADQTYLSRSQLDHRLRYEVDASPGAAQQVNGRIDRQFYLALPDGISDRVRRQAAEIAARAPDTEGRLAALAEFFREQQLRYAQEDLPGGPDVIGQFLYEKQRGYCEFFASAYVTLARLAGVPARLVGGYLGGDYNPLGGYYLVTEDRAHVWAEVLTDDNRWQRVDPSQWAVNAAATLGARRQTSLDTLRQLADSLNYRWVQAVVVFDLGRQLTLFREATDQLRAVRPPRIPARVLLPFLLLALLAAAAWLGRRRRGRTIEGRLLRRFRTRVGRRYGAGALSPATGLAELAERLDDPHCREFARIFQGAVFRDRPLAADEIRRLRQLLKKI